MNRLFHLSLRSVVLACSILMAACGGGLPPLSLTTGSLPHATAGIAYNQALQATGGLPPYTWTLANGGAPPAGLALTSNGTVVGSPTAGGNFSFSVQVADSRNPRSTANGKVTMTVVVPPLSVSTTSLPNGTVDTPYSHALQATGGVPPYGWTISSGSLPSWASLNSQGVLAGFPNAAGTSNFTVTVADAETPALTANQALSITSVPGAGANNSELKGHYAFLFSGFDDATGKGEAVAGSFTADGVGNIINGLQDINGSSGPTLNVPFTGTYNIGTDNRGAFTIETSSGTKTYACVIGALSGGIATNGRFIEFDDTSGTNGQRGSGILRLQDTTAFSLASITGPYAFGLVGREGSGARSAIVGSFSADGKGNLPSGVADESIAGTATNPTLTGSYSAPSTSNGRGMLTLSPTGSSSWNLSVYVVSSGDLLGITTDADSSSGLHTGSMLSQKSTSFTNSSFNAPAILYDSGADLSSQQPPSAEIGILSPDGNGSLQATLDQNAGGVISQNVSFAATYAVTSIGRVTVNGWRASNTSPARYLYLVDANKAFYLDSGPAVGFGFVEPQAAAPSGGFTNASLSGAFLSSTVPPSLGTLPDASAQGTLDGASAFSETVDVSSSTGLVVGQITRGAYSIGTNGRGTVTSLTTSGIVAILLLAVLSLLVALLCAPKWRHQPALRPTFGLIILLALILASVDGCVFSKPELVFYVISSKKFVLIDQSKSNTTPTVAIFEQ